MRRIKKKNIRLQSKIENETKPESDGKQNTEFCIDVVASLFTPPTYYKNWIR